MRIKMIHSKHRRDFYATYTCEHCGVDTPKRSGYDDENFHRNVIPNMLCPSCGKSSEDKTPRSAPKYDDSVVI